MPHTHTKLEELAVLATHSALALNKMACCASNMNLLDHSSGDREAHQLHTQEDLQQRPSLCHCAALHQCHSCACRPGSECNRLLFSIELMVIHKNLWF